MVEVLRVDNCQNCGVRKGVGHYKHKFQGEGRSSTNDSWHQKTRVPGLSGGIICMILRIAVLVKYRLTACDRHTEKRWWLIHVLA